MTLEAIQAAIMRLPEPEQGWDAQIEKDFSPGGAGTGNLDLFTVTRPGG